MHQHHSIQAVLSHLFTLGQFLFVTNLHFVMLVILAWQSYSTQLMVFGMCWQNETHQIRYKALVIVVNKKKYLILDVNIVMNIVLLSWCYC